VWLLLLVEGLVGDNLPQCNSSYGVAAIVVVSEIFGHLCDPPP